MTLFLKGREPTLFLKGRDAQKLCWGKRKPIEGPELKLVEMILNNVLSSDSWVGSLLAIRSSTFNLQRCIGETVTDLPRCYMQKATERSLFQLAQIAFFRALFVGKTHCTQHSLEKTTQLGRILRLKELRSRDIALRKKIKAPWKSALTFHLGFIGKQTKQDFWRLCKNLVRF